VVAEFSALLKGRGITTVKGDHYSGAWSSDEFARNGVRYVPSAQTKSEIYLAALPLLLSGRARLLDDEKLRRQLSGLERRAHANGRESVDHAAGSAAHDDLANAALGACVHAAAYKSAVIAGPIVFSANRSIGFDNVMEAGGAWDRIMREEAEIAAARERRRVNP
jgi:hypothetical protein